MAAIYIILQLTTCHLLSYLAQLRILATSYASLPAETKRQMTKSAFLLAGKKIQTQNAQKRMLMGGLLAAKDSIADEDEDEGIIDWDLSRATEVRPPTRRFLDTTDDFLTRP